MLNEITSSPLKGQSVSLSAGEMSRNMTGSSPLFWWNVTLTLFIFPKMVCHSSPSCHSGYSLTRDVSPRYCLLFILSIFSFFFSYSSSSFHPPAPVCQALIYITPCSTNTASSPHQPWLLDSLSPISPAAQSFTCSPCTRSLRPNMLIKAGSPGLLWQPLKLVQACCSSHEIFSIFSHLSLCVGQVFLYLFT